jgi:hypothetical protein
MGFIGIVGLTEGTVGWGYITCVHLASEYTYPLLCPRMHDVCVPIGTTSDWVVFPTCTCRYIIVDWVLLEQIETQLMMFVGLYDFLHGDVIEGLTSG